MLVLKGKADFQARDEKGRTAREYAAAQRLVQVSLTSLNSHALRSYAVTRKHDKIAAFLDCARPHFGHGHQNRLL